MRRTRSIAYPVLALTLALTAGAAGAQTTPARIATVHIDIKPQSLGSALTQFGAQTGIRVFVYSDIAAGLNTGGVSGQLSADDALSQLLANTGLTYSYINPKAVEIHRMTESIRGTSLDTQMAASPATAAAPSDARAPTDEADLQASHDDRIQTVSEVIVTAQKRKQNILDVPISITAINSEDIERRKLVGADDYLRGLPGVNQTNEAEGQTITIRGLETSPAAQNFSSGNTVATYFGETATTNSAGLAGDTNVDLKLVDIERVEVLRGPQGTAFGSSSLGGAVRTIPVAPKLDRVEGKVNASYSDTSGLNGQNYDAQGVINIPLVADMLAVRAVAYNFRDAGYYRNVAGSDPALQATFARYGAQSSAVDFRQVGGTDTWGGRLAMLLQPTDDFKLTVSYLTQESGSTGFGFANRPGYVQALPLVAPQQAIDGTRQPASQTKIQIANATGELDLHWADLLATYSYV